MSGNVPVLQGQMRKELCQKMKADGTDMRLQYYAKRERGKLLEFKNRFIFFEQVIFPAGKFLKKGGIIFDSVNF